MGITPCMSILLLASASALTGCGSYYTINHYETIPGSYQVLENGNRKNLHLAIFDLYVYQGLMLDTNSAAVLCETPPRSIFEAQSLLHHTPRERELSGFNWADLGTIAGNMIIKAEEVRRTPDHGRPVYWIISINPPILAEGVQREDPHIGTRYYDGRSFGLGKLAESRDLSQLATAIYIIDKFPSESKPLSGDEQIHWDNMVREMTRRIVLPRPISLDGILKSRASLWFPAATPGRSAGEFGGTGAGSVPFRGNAP
jgi:hypothetical protein